MAKTGRPPSVPPFNRRLTSIWQNMKRRTGDVGNKSYKWYGARGITVCDEWQDYKVFREWAESHGYDPSLTIDRIDGNLGYCPTNCRWVTLQINALNRSKRKDFGIRKHGKKWDVMVTRNNIGYYIGTFVNITEARKAKKCFFKNGTYISKYILYEHRIKKHF